MSQKKITGGKRRRGIFKNNKKNEPLISVIMVCLNSQKYLIKPILKITNSKSLKKISEEIMKYYNTYNRFGVKLPAPDYGDSPEWFKDDMFSTTSVFINEEYQGFLDMNIMEKNFKKGFSNKVKNNEPYLPTEFRNYFDPPELWKRALFVGKHK